MALFNLFNKPKTVLDDITKTSQKIVASTEEKSPKTVSEGVLARLRRGLNRTRNQLTDGLAQLFLGARQIDADLFEELETQLLTADVGIETTTAILDNLTKTVERLKLSDPQVLYQALQQQLQELLLDCQQPLQIDNQQVPYVILLVGVNGAGKTTTIGKLAHHFQAQGKSVLLAAGDTFRAAAVEQLQAWGARNQVAVVAQHTGADSASVIFDAVQSARSRSIDIVLADTAGRLQNKAHLMDELGKVVRVMGKLDRNLPHEVMLVIDAGTGQNALSQAGLFNSAVGVTGITLTKLDGTARGGVIFAIAQQLQLPIRFIGVGEQAQDLRPFDAKTFIHALFNQKTE
jgi:fused signal recognition particle receptor